MWTTDRILDELRALRNDQRLIHDDIHLLIRKVYSMSATSDQLTAAVADLADKVLSLDAASAAHDSEVKAEMIQLATAVAASNAKDDPAVLASIEKVRAASTKIAATTATIAQETVALAASVGVTTADPVDPATPVDPTTGPTGATDPL